MSGFFSRIKQGLSKTRAAMVERIAAAVGGGLDEEAMDQIEAILIQADVGVETAVELVEKLRARRGTQGEGTAGTLRLLKEELVRALDAGEAGTPGKELPSRPYIVLVVGVNGVGKTTTIGKLAGHYAGGGNKVMVAACDTFRAAAAEQLEIWAARAGVDMVRAQQGADPAAVAFDAAAAARARGVDVLLVDTAGRLHTRTNLMEELKKIRRSLARQEPGAPHETLLVLDATTGQNTLSQARQFNQAAELSGLVLTKLDGTARGGIVLALRRELDLPVKWIGIGEALDDLHPFESRAFVEALFAG